MRDNQDRRSSEVGQRYAGDVGRPVPAGQVEAMLTALDIAGSVRHARQVVSVSVEVRLLNEELRHRCVLLCQRAVNARQQSQNLRKVTPRVTRG